MNSLLWGVVPFLVLGLWLYTAWISSTLPTLLRKRIALLIAHPDDEAMFFAPTLLALARPEHGNHISILCLSSGNADGLGKTRKAELVKSGLHLGLRSEEDIAIVEDANLPDSMTANWEPKFISRLLTKQYAPKMSKLDSKQQPQTNIDVLITFDRHGVSAHPNHQSLYHGSRVFLKDLMRRHSGWEPPIKFYTLTTTNVLRKYLSILDAPASILSIILSRKEVGANPAPLLFVSGAADCWTAQTTMTRAHKSQMKWFRWGWIVMSRYMVINVLRKEKVV